MRQRTLALLVPALVLAGTGCATKDYVREVVGQSQAQTDTRIGEQTKRIDEQATRVEEQATRVDKQLGEVGGRVTKLETSVDEFGNIARTAVTKADEAIARADEVSARVSRALGARYERKLVETIHVQFGLDRADLTDAAQTALAELIKELAENPALTVDLEGYTDSTGSVQHNLQLADRRAGAVRRFLVAHGVDLSRINWIGMGKLEGPERAKNRRVTVRLMLPGDEPGMAESRGGGGEEKAGAAGAEKTSEAPADTAVAGDKAMRDGDTATATHEKPAEAPAATEKESQ
jgi:outer membrane protein OmpA-like peptidoglycan-associated protein